MPAELVFFGTVLTVDDGRRTAEALAVADGRSSRSAIGPTSPGGSDPTPRPSSSATAA
jgi:hypothetical protein